MVFERNASAAGHVDARDDHVLERLSRVSERVGTVVEPKLRHTVQRARLELAVDARSVDAVRRCGSRLDAWTTGVKAAGVQVDITEREGCRRCRAVLVRSVSPVWMRCRRGAVVLAGVTGGVALAACGGQTPSPKPLSPRQLLQTALNDASARGSVHEAETAEMAGRRETFSDDVGVGEGRQAITLADGQVAHVLVVGGEAYIAGSESVLGHYFGFPPSAVRAIRGRWVGIPSSSRAYSTVAYDATLATALQSFALAGPLTQTAPGTWNGQSVVGVQGEAPSSGAASSSVAATVYLSRASEPLPVGATYRFSNGASATATLDGWGEHLFLRAPTHVITQSAVQQASRGSSRRSAGAAVPPNTHANDPDSAWTGYWLATGQVLEAHDSAIQTPGEIIHRVWRIYRSCASQRCALDLERQTAGPTANTLGGPLTAPLTTANGGWATSFSEPDVYCRGTTADYPGTEDSAWHLSQATPGTITALETTRTSGPNCETGTTKIVWTARRAAAHSSAPA